MINRKIVFQAKFKKDGDLLIPVYNKKQPLRGYNENKIKIRFLNP